MVVPGVLELLAVLHRADDTVITVFVAASLTSTKEQ